jgi:hypothetical protein
MIAHICISRRTASNIIPLLLLVLLLLLQAQ